jgi:hypothetical protein
LSRVSGTIYPSRTISSAGRAFDSHSRGRRFEPCIVHHLKTFFLAFFFGFVVPLLLSSPSLTLSPSPTPAATPTPLPAIIYIPDVPFTSQAPFGDWKDPREQDGCEEAASLIAVSWARNQKLTPVIALEQIFAIAKYETDNFGQYTDTSAQDTHSRIIQGYFNYPNSEVISINTVSDLITPLNQGKLVIVPTNGWLLGNPNFTAPGPERHNLVLRGYDRLKKEFISNDPGTRKGENYRYPQDVLFNALRDYPTGEHLPITTISKTAILISR